MSNEVDNSIYRFQYGELNDVTPAEGPLYRQSSGRESGIGTLGRSIRENHRPDPFEGIQEWYGVVLRVELTPEEGASEDEFVGWEKLHRKYSDNPDLVRIKVRIPELHATITEPRNLSADPEALSVEDQLAIDRHPTFISEMVGMPTPNIGDIVKVFYDRQSGQAIYLDRIMGSGVAATSGIYGVAGSTAFAAGSGLPPLPVGAIDFSQGATVGGKPDPDPGEAPGPNLDFTWDELEILRVPLQPLLDYIAAREGNYDSVNRGSSGDTPDVSQVITGVTGLRTMTIAQVQAYQKGGAQAGDVDMSTLEGRPAPSSTPGLLAVGKYQFIPDTLNSIVGDTGIPSTSLFNENTQERLGVGLLVYKRRTLGKYLLGMYDSLEYAAQNLAREWSSQPIVWPENDCQRGQSRYCDEGGNMAHYTPEQSATALTQARAMVAGNAPVQQLLRQKGYIGGTTS